MVPLISPFRRARQLAVLILALLAVSALAYQITPATTARDAKGHLYAKGRIVVGFKDTLSASSATKGSELFGGKVDATIPQIRVAVITFPQSTDVFAKIAEIKKDLSIRYAEPDYISKAAITPDDPLYSQQWGPPKVGCEAAWEVTQGDPSVVIAIIDTGVDYTHIDLVGKVIKGFDYVNNDWDPMDDNSHGTHCAGIAAANTFNGIGVAGVCCQCKVLAIKVLDNTGTGTDDWIAQAIVYAADNGAWVISMSLGHAGSPSSDVEDALAYAQGKGIVICAAAGNDGVDEEFYPARFGQCLAVGSSDPNDSRSSFSNYGAWVHLAAPGSGILSTVPGSQYGYKSGTSMATPMVAGAAGLLYSTLGTPSTTNAAAIIQKLESTAVPVGNWVIYGRLNLAAALDISPTTMALDVVPSPAWVLSTVDITPTVTPTPDGGTVFFQDNSVLIGSVSPGQTLHHVFTTLGPHHLIALYSGTRHFESARADFDLQVIQQPTTTTVVAVPNPGVVRQEITITPTVTGAASPIPDGGTIAIKDDGNLIGTLPLGGSMTWKFNTAKIHVISAEYSGDTNYLPSTGSVNLEIDKAPTQTTLTANPAIGATGAPTTLHAVVVCTVDGNPPDPPGTVDFWDTSAFAKDLGSEPMGTDLTYTPWFAGTHALEARYSGNDNFLPSTGPLSYAIVPYLIPNFIWDYWNGPNPAPTMFRPEVINVDGITLRDILTYNGAVIDKTLVVQMIRLQKRTPSLKCTAFVSGPGSGLNTNFDTGYKKATDADLDKALVNLALGVPQGEVALGNRALLFSPPGTTYTLTVVYVTIEPNGRPSVPHTVTRVIQLMVPSRDNLRKEIEYFATVAAGATQKPKITADVTEALYKALDTPDDLGALIALETVVGETATDFSTLVNTPDVRFMFDYLIDSDEEPIGCLLVEQANALLWH